ncbi:hypothetical protein N8702_00600 [Verrucomicrobia bacterium]|nr:hypothetical protein [Verrucomicrobiota bacterium]MDA7660184.1 hypothetical protein [Verrucomicrobiota bacterium]
MFILKKCLFACCLFSFVCVAQPDLKRQAASTVQVVNGFVVDASPTDGGLGYAHPPSVKFTGGHPDEVAQAETVLEGGSVVGVNIINAGSGYKETPHIIIMSPHSEVNLAVSFSKTETTLPDSDLSQSALATPEIFKGFMVGAKIVYGGQGYKTPPLITVVDSTGSGALAASTIEDGVVTNIRFVQAGIGYSDQAFIQMDAPPMHLGAMPSLNEVQVTIKPELPSNFYILEASVDMETWEQVDEQFYVDKSIYTKKVRVDGRKRFYRAIQLP